ncbi:hypothetical protein M8818_004879, partial [Zalaria obscura]
MPDLTGDPKQHPPSTFSTSLSGHCLCGSIAVTITDSELFTKRRGHLCHCANCRKVAGSYVSSNLVIEKDKVAIEDRNGTLKEFVDTETGSGNALSRFFCGTCGNAQWMTSVMADPTTTAEPAVASCVNSCAASDLDCQASCVGVPAASNSALVSSATNCMAKCPQGNAQAYPDCIEGCINSYFLTSTSIPTMGGTTVLSAYGTPTSGALLTATAVTTTKATTGPAAESSEASSLSQVASS